VPGELHLPGRREVDVDEEVAGLVRVVADEVVGNTAEEDVAGVRRDVRAPAASPVRLTVTRRFEPDCMSRTKMS
jgi:hypothetical protein